MPPLLSSFNLKQPSQSAVRRHHGNLHVLLVVLVLVLQSCCATALSIAVTFEIVPRCHTTTVLNEQSPPLLVAAFRGDAEDIPLLLSGGANIETKGDDGATALSFFCGCQWGTSLRWRLF
ncbi:membrane-associated protein, putative [Bodo saltans]|uniref:Membrane-associated protein, putative n=1 Tax=Bodo saltans TaxID=75058 RepID=A0A0S4IVY1_BODSA|nr:membrane-associated protein, putative [Bodo saltans]|eukprot:CUG05310.1 membrane-associated protein, putative [Bodo saltans]